MPILTWLRLTLPDPGDGKTADGIEYDISNKHGDRYNVSAKGVALLSSPSRSLRSSPQHHARHTRETLVMLGEVGRGSTSRVFKCLFVPALELLAIKSMNAASATMQTAANEMKMLFSVNKVGWCCVHCVVP